MYIPQILQGFHANAKPLDTDKKWVLAVVDSHILLAEKSDACSQNILFDSDEIDALKFFCERRIIMGQWQGSDCEVWHMLPEAGAVQGYKLLDLRSLLVNAADDIFSLACRAVQLLDWRAKHVYCGCCGSAMVACDQEHAMQCSACHISNYPRISPCIIVLVSRGKQCLLARQPSWPEGRFSVLAGFLEAGETVEQGLHREVFEEVNIEIDNIRYMGSQSWPFPGQLMLGFMAEAKTHAIEVDGVEISEAQWWHYDNLPESIPPATTMSGRLIQQFVSEASAL